jgi:probable HAF family extracellular repeat protein
VIEGLGGFLTVPYDVNSSGIVVGESDTTGGERHAFMWTADGGGPEGE